MTRVIRQRRELVCPKCDTTFVGGSSRSVYCSVACRVWKGPGKRPLYKTCDYTNCTEALPSLRHTYCSAHGRLVKVLWKRNSRGGSLRKTYDDGPQIKVCCWCSKDFTTLFEDVEWCSERCHKGYKRGYIYDKECLTCAQPLDGRLNQLFCNNNCRCLHNNAVRKMRLRGLPYELINRYEVYTRDEGICHLCNEYVDWEDFSWDHIIPIANYACPGHIKANLATTHKGCNSGKRDRVTDKDFILFARLSLLELSYE